MQVTVLGAASVRRGGGPVDLGGPKVRSLLAALALYAGRAVSPDRIIDLLWPRDAPPAVTASLQTYVAKLRRALEPERAARAPSTVLLTSPAGYALHLPAGALDAARFRGAVEDAHRRLPRPAAELPRVPPELTADDLQALRQQLANALGLWSDTPYLDLPDDDAVIAERAGLTALQLVAAEDLALVRVALGEESSVAVDVEQLVAAHPLRESLCAVWILALARSGQQHEALAAARAVRRTLADELGVDPGPVLQHLERAVLQQSAHLWWRPAAPPTRPAPAPQNTSVPAGTDLAVPPGEPAPASAGQPAAADWPLIGRSTQLERLLATIHQAAAGAGKAAMLVGEPGIGKSRLLRELAARAVAEGFLVAGGSCSQDDGAPSLWPWSRILAAVDEAQPVPPQARVDVLAARGAKGAEDTDQGSRWELWEAVLARLRAAAATRPLVVILDDLHWADQSTLFLLRHLVQRLAEPGVATRIAIVAARRRQPEPQGTLAALGETLARTDAARLELDGLQPAEIEQLARVATGTELAGDRARELWERTGGNAFFVTEQIRLELQGGTASATEIPSTVSDVVLSRLSALPAASRRIVGVAAVIGREFDAVLLAAVTVTDVDGILDLLEPVLATGLVIERSAGQFQFSHALVRDAIGSALPPTRRALRHADIAAALDRGQSLDLRRARSEAARHWLAAGPQHAPTAWRAAAAVAADAMSRWAWEEAADLLTQAIAVTALDPAATDLDRYRLRMQLADAFRWSGDRAGMDVALRAAIVDAERLGDDELAARAAIGSLEGAAWFPRAYAEVETDRVRALRRSLDRLPTEDSELRCRVMLALALELYYADAPQEIEALTEQGLAMAQRIDDPALLVWASIAAFQARWQPSTAQLRHEWMTQAVQAAVSTGDARTEAVTRYLLAGAAQETGRIDEMHREIELSLSLAEQYRLPMVQVALGWLKAPWFALQGRYEQAYAMVAQTATLMQRTSMNQQAEALAGAAMTIQVIQGKLDDVVVQQFSMAAADSKIPMSANVLIVLLRAGRRGEAEAWYARDGLTLGPESWFSLISDSMAAEVAAEFGNRELAMQVYRRLAPYAGRPASAAASSAIWPVDWFLAVAAAATGEKTVAATHADRALDLCAQWGIEPATAWIRSQRERYGF